MTIYFVCSCLGYCPFRQSFFPQLWTFLNVLLKKLRGNQHLKEQNHNVQMLRYLEIKYKNPTQYQAQPPNRLYPVLAHLTVTMNAQLQICRLNFHDNLRWRRLSPEQNMHRLELLREISFVCYNYILLIFFTVTCKFLLYEGPLFGFYYKILSIQYCKPIFLRVLATLMCFDIFAVSVETDWSSPL